MGKFEVLGFLRNLIESAATTAFGGTPATLQKGEEREEGEKGVGVTCIQMTLVGAGLLTVDLLARLRLFQIKCSLCLSVAIDG